MITHIYLLTKYEVRNILNALDTSFIFKHEKKEFNIEKKNLPVHLLAIILCQVFLSSLTKTDLLLW